MVCLVYHILSNEGDAAFLRSNWCWCPMLIIQSKICQHPVMKRSLKGHSWLKNTDPFEDIWNFGNMLSLCRYSFLKQQFEVGNMKPWLLLKNLTRIVMKTKQN